jgi:hypothetical protein
MPPAAAAYRDASLEKFIAVRYSVFIAAMQRPVSVAGSIATRSGSAGRARNAFISAAIRIAPDVARLLFWQASDAASYGELAVLKRRPMHLSAAASDLAELRIANTVLRQMLAAGHVTEPPNPLRSHRVN